MSVGYEEAQGRQSREVFLLNIPLAKAIFLKPKWLKNTRESKSSEVQKSKKSSKKQPETGCAIDKSYVQVSAAFIVKSKHWNRNLFTAALFYKQSNINGLQLFDFSSDMYSLYSSIIFHLHSFEPLKIVPFGSTRKRLSGQSVSKANRMLCLEHSHNRGDRTYPSV